MSHELKTGGDRGYLRIATEEAFATREQIDCYLRMVKDGSADKGMVSLWGFYARSPSERATQIIERLLDLGEQRLRHMDETGIDRAVIALTSPGAQPLTDPAAARGLAQRANDYLAAEVAARPDRYIGMTTLAPQDPEWSAREILRGARELGFKGVQINSHTQGQYLDHPRFDPIFRALADTGQPLYIHPATPPDSMIAPMLEAGLDGAIFGFGVETALHTLRLIMSGVFDRFPRLKVVIGHMGEALPFWLFRLDYMYRATLNSKRYPHLKPNRKLPSDYMRENIYVTTSGMPWGPAILFGQQVLGVERVLYAMDYPYQFVAEEVTATDDLPICAADKKLLFQTNAEKVFRL